MTGLSGLRKPVRNLPAVGSRHQCSMIVTRNEDGNELGEAINLKDELSCKQNELQNGSIFTCEDIVTIAGKTGACGKEWVLHYPTTFAWKVRRAVVASDDGATAQEPAQEPAPSGKRDRKH